MVGAAIGGSTGLYNGLRRSVLAGESGKLRRTQVKIFYKNITSKFLLCNLIYFFHFLMPRLHFGNILKTAHEIVYD